MCFSTHFFYSYQSVPLSISLTFVSLSLSVSFNLESILSLSLSACVCHAFLNFHFVDLTLSVFVSDCLWVSYNLFTVFGSLSKGFFNFCLSVHLSRHSYVSLCLRVRLFCMCSHFPSIFVCFQGSLSWRPHQSFNVRKGQIVFKKNLQNKPLCKIAFIHLLPPSQFAVFRTSLCSVMERLCPAARASHFVPLWGQTFLRLRSSPMLVLSCGEGIVVFLFKLCARVISHVWNVVRVAYLCLHHP